MNDRSSVSILDEAARMRARYPRLKPAAPLPCRPGASYSPRFAAAEWARFCSRGWRIRQPAWLVEGLIEGTGRGDCLVPFLPDGDVVTLFDPALAADDGDLVLVAFSDAFAQRVIDTSMQEPAQWRDNWMRTHAPSAGFSNLAMKVLRHGDNALWATCATYGFRLDRVGTVLGVCRHLEIDGVPVYGSHGAAYRYAEAWLNNFIRPWRVFQ